jgi:hypothetical protein
MEGDYMSEIGEYQRGKRDVEEARALEEKRWRDTLGKSPTTAAEGNGKLEIGEVWNDGVDVKAPEVGKKFDTGKPRWDLLPESIRSVVAVITYGAGKYGDENWKQVSGWRRRYAAAAFRHMTSWLYGERLDAETGLPHLAHAATNMLFLLELDK